MHWTKEYPKVLGWYWIKAGLNCQQRLEHFFPSDKNGKLCSTDDWGEEHGEECFKGYWFSSEPIQDVDDL